MRSWWRATGLRLAATPVGSLAAGQPVVVGIRPEDLVVLEGAAEAGAADQGDAPTPNGTSQIRAHVEIVEYQGRELAMDVLTADGIRLHVRTQPRLAPGDPLVLTVTVDHVRAFPDDRGGDGVPGETGSAEAAEFATGAMAGRAAP